ncbi:glycoside hydrolase N-terminal domain-containing protein [Kineococcus sp. NUM-3379]
MATTPADTGGTCTGEHEIRLHGDTGAWEESLPVGNGLLGASCSGRHGGEHLALNDTTAWSGGPWSPAEAEHRATGGPAQLAAAREALAAGRVREAEELLTRFQTPWTQAYQPLAALNVSVCAAGDPVGGGTPGTRPEVVRRLDLDAAEASTSYTLATPGGPAAVRHATFASHPDRVLVHEVRAEAEVDVTVRLDGPHPQELWQVEPGTGPDGERLRVAWLLPADVAPGHEDVPDPVRYPPPAAPRRWAGCAVVLLHDGRAEEVPGGLRVLGARSAALVLASASTQPPPSSAGDGSGVDAPGPLLGRLAERAGRAAALGPAVLRERHRADHRALYRRVELRLPPGPHPAGTPVDERVAAAARGAEDPGLLTLAFHHGRYLLIASSRPGGLPATLQGLWNTELRPPWSSNYTLNINLQMAYWPAHTTALDECARPLADFLAVLAAQGGRTARELYGAPGWVAHHNSDAWGHSAPVGAGHGDAAWAFWPVAGAWLCRHLLEAARFRGDPARRREALREAWPVLEGAGRFALHWIRPAPGGGTCSAPSTSPENHYVAADGAPAAVTVSTTADVALLRNLAAGCAEAAAGLGADPPWVADLLAATAALPGPRVDARGRLAEWPGDVADAEPHHRHVSHLVGVFPLGDVADPALLAAAARSLDTRGGESTGWSLAWKLALRARLRQPERAHELVRMLLRPAAGEGVQQRGGVYPNLWSAHPPFQLDGNLGLTAGVAELLLDSAVRGGRPELELLPALPPAWPVGEVRGLRGRGGVEVDLRWASGRLVAAWVRTESDAVVVLRHRGRSAELACRAGERAGIPAGLLGG